MLDEPKKSQSAKVLEKKIAQHAGTNQKGDAKKVRNPQITLI